MEEESDPHRKAQQQQTMKLKPATCGVLEGIFMVLKNIFKDQMKHMEDYRK